MRARLAELDRVSADIANASTAGYKTERATTAQSDRPDFGAELTAAIDVAEGPTKVDMRSGSIVPTGRDLDAAIDGPGFFTVETKDGERYTRDGRFVRRADGVLATANGEAVEGLSGNIILGKGAVQIDADGTVRSGGAVAGRLRIVEFDNPKALARENSSLLRAENNASSSAAEISEVRGGALEQSNVSVVDRIAEMTGVSRSFESLQRALSTLANEVDGKAIAELGRRA
jgi:flagellar basal body rod protein FlgG